MFGLVRFVPAKVPLSYTSTGLLPSPTIKKGADGSHEAMEQYRGLVGTAIINLSLAKSQKMAEK